MPEVCYRRLSFKGGRNPDRFFFFFLMECLKKCKDFSFAGRQQERKNRNIKLKKVRDQIVKEGPSGFGLAY